MRKNNKRKHSDTSKAAYESMKGKPIHQHYKKIIIALHAMGNGIYEEIANHIGFAHTVAASRRLSELDDLGIVERTGKKRLTSSNRAAHVYRLTTKGFNTAMGLQQTSLFPETKTP